jgi:hypothetical protein
MLRFARIQKALFIPILVVLVLFEMYMLTAFLPRKWQHAINEQLVVPLLAPFDRESYEQSKITHPNLEEEIDQALKENPRLRISSYVIFAVLLSGNALLIAGICSKLSRKS